MATATDLTTIQNVKAHIGLDPGFTDDDAWIVRQITAQSAYFTERADRMIRSSTYVETIGGNSDRIRQRTSISAFGGLYQSGFGGSGGFGFALTLDNSPVISITSITIDGGDSTGATTPVPVASSIGSSTQVDGYLIVGDRIELVGSTYAFTHGIGNIVITYVAGYAAVPVDIEDAVIDLVAWKYRARQHIGERSKSDGSGGSIFFDANPPASVASTIGQYIRVKH